MSRILRGNEQIAIASEESERMFKFRQRLEQIMMAVAFAESGEHETARLMLGAKRKSKVARKYARKEKRLELRAPDMRR